MKRKTFETKYFGTFTYRDIPSSAFPFDVKIEKEEDFYYRLAEPEKALCDLLYTLPPVRNQKEMAL